MTFSIVETKFLPMRGSRKENNMYPMYPNFQQSFPQNQQQNNGFVSVRSELEARNYPVAYGNSVTFKDETAPYVYTKTMGFSQLDRPVFEKYKLVKEESEEAVEKPVDSLEKIRSDISSLWKEVNALKKKRRDNDEHNANV